MKWYKITEKNPRNKGLVAIWYRQNFYQPVDSRYDITVYNSYMFAFYKNKKWLDLDTYQVDLASKYRIDKWCEVPFHDGRTSDEEILDPIKDRFSILDL